MTKPRTDLPAESFKVKAAPRRFNLAAEQVLDAIPSLLPNEDVRTRAEAGDATAQFTLAESLLDGRGVPQDYELAYFWSNLAAGNASSDVREAYVALREQIAGHLSQAQIFELQKRTRTWAPVAPPLIGGTAYDRGRQLARAFNLSAPSSVSVVYAGSVSVVYAGFWRRTMALLVDGAITNVAARVIGGVGFGVVLSGTALEYVVLVVVSLLTNWLYFTLCESSTQQATLGKRMLSLRVTDTHGQRIGFGQANGRYWSKILSGLLLGIGLLMVGFDRQKQGLHDKIAGTFVLRSSSS